MQGFLEQTGITFPVVWDEGTYDLFAWPASISPFPREALVGADGTVRYVAAEYYADALEAAIVEALAE